MIVRQERIAAVTLAFAAGLERSRKQVRQHTLVRSFLSTPAEYYL